MMANNAQILKALHRGLAVACQAPIESPLHDAYVIAALAEAAIAQNAIAVRVETRDHVAAVRSRISAPIIAGVQSSDDSMTSQFEQIAAIAKAGADVIAIAARLHAQNESLFALIGRIQQELGILVLAEIDSVEAAIGAVDAGADLIGTGLYSATAETNDFSRPGFDLLSQLAETLDTPILYSGGIASPQIARQALDLGAYVVVVGTAIVGIEARVQAYDAALRQEMPAIRIEHSEPYRFALFDQEHSSYRGYIRTKLRQFNTDSTAPEGFFDQVALRGLPLEVFLLDDRHKIKAGLIGLTRWNWLLVETLWVEESLRQRGFGRRLMQIAEAEAKQRGCTEAILDTFSFQAKGFYEKLGYQMFAQVDDYPSGYSFYQLKKEF